jgi:excisionase family DNA binding protein
VRRLILLPVGDPAPDDLIEPKEAAAILGVSRSSVYNAVNDGRLTAYYREFDGQLRLSRAEVLRAARFKPKRSRAQDSQAG